MLVLKWISLGCVLSPLLLSQPTLTPNISATSMLSATACTLLALVCPPPTDTP